MCQISILLPIVLVTEDILQKRSKESNFYRLVTAYREHGHKKAEIDPVSMEEYKK